jgi:DNA-binding protein YbaB
VARPGAFKSEKRKKEVQRLKKQEEKRQKRIKKDEFAPKDGSEIAPVEATGEAGTEKTES